MIAAEQRKIELLKEYSQSLISEAVTGKIDVRNEVYTKLTGFVLFFHFANPLKTDMCLHLLSVFGEPLTPFHNRFFKRNYPLLKFFFLMFAAHLVLRLPDVVDEVFAKSNRDV